MNSERFQQIDQLFQAALQQAPSARTAFLARACAGDAALQQEVERLLWLDANAPASAAWEQLPEQVAAAWAKGAPGQRKAGRQFGHFQVERLLGHGGMGEVYLATDTRLKRQVALKFLRSEATREPARIKRFQQEAQAASALNHPNIVTIFEIDKLAGEYFIATEFIAGQTLRQRLQNERLTLKSALDIARQVASALAVAHAAGVIHRDIKPENIMLRQDGLVKVLDFGVAKLVTLAEASTSALVTDSPSQLRLAGSPALPFTTHGAVVGTVAYMSPEQACGDTVDARSDLFSLGIVLYELLTGSTPFPGETVSERLHAIKSESPLPLPPEFPSQLQRIVTQALQKDPALRYQSAAEMLADVQACTASLAPASHSPHPLLPALDRPRSRLKAVRYRHFTLAVLILLLLTSAGWYLSRRLAWPPAHALTSQDTVLLTDWVNQTGEDVFDGTLKLGLAVQLQQSPFFSLLPELRVRETLRLMGRAPGASVTRESGREVALRQGVKAVLTGRITKFDRRYVLTIEAFNSQTGEVLALVQSTAESKDQVLEALTTAAATLRRQLGETLSSVQNFAAPLAVTTNSLDALKAFSIGQDLTTQGKLLEAVPHNQRAIELDPNFAQAYLALAITSAKQNHTEQAAAYALRAFNLRDKLSELERLNVTSFYYAFVTGELEKLIAAQTQLKQAYPRLHIAPGNLGVSYGQIGQYERAVAEIRLAQQLNPNTAAWFINLAHNLIALNQFAEARQVCQQAQAQKIDGLELHSLLFTLDFINNDLPAQARHLAWAKDRPEEYAALNWQTGVAAYQGQWQRAQALAQQAIDLAQRNGAPELAAQYAAEQALRAAALGQRQAVKPLTDQALARTRNRNTLTRAALALALNGAAAEARSLAAELDRLYPKRTLIQELWLPLIRAAVALKQNQPTVALRWLEPANRYEPAAEFWVTYLRGQAYWQERNGQAALAEFEKLLLHRGWAPSSVLYPLAHAGVAQAAILVGDQAKGQQATQALANLWKEADPALSAPLGLCLKEEGSH